MKNRQLEANSYPRRELIAKAGDEVKLGSGYRLIIEHVSKGAVTVRIQEPQDACPAENDAQTEQKY